MSTYANEKTLYDYIIKNNIPDGNHTLTLYNNVSIDIELYNFYNDVEYSVNPILGDNIPDTKMLILVYHKNLTIDTNVILTPQVRKKGMVIYCYGKLINNGNISMTARGASATGQDVYLIENLDGTFEYIPAVGGTGGANVSAAYALGNPGISGNNRQTGGGGAGGGAGHFSGSISPSGSGSAGTSFSGGTGGGGAGGGEYTGGTGGNASPNGGKGGDGSGFAGGYPSAGGSGAGNPAGNINTSTYHGGKGYDGTGELLIIMATTIINSNNIQSNGSNGGYGIDTVGGVYWTCGSGGGSGAGSINIFYINSYTNRGTIQSNGGKAGVNGTSGGNGGDGCITISKLPMKFLIKDDTRIKTTDSTNLTDIGNVNNITLFNSYGIYLYSINSTVLDKVSNIKYNIELIR